MGSFCFEYSKWNLKVKDKDSISDQEEKCIRGISHQINKISDQEKLFNRHYLVGTAAVMNFLLVLPPLMLLAKIPLGLGILYVISAVICTIALFWLIWTQHKAKQLMMAAVISNLPQWQKEAELIISLSKDDLALIFRRRDTTTAK
jgi:hypothetical protein